MAKSAVRKTKTKTNKTSSQSKTKPKSKSQTRSQTTKRPKIKPKTKTKTIIHVIRTKSEPTMKEFGKYVLYKGLYDAMLKPPGPQMKSTGTQPTREMEIQTD